MACEKCNHSDHHGTYCLAITGSFGAICTCPNPMKSVEQVAYETRQALQSRRMAEHGDDDEDGELDEDEEEREE